jgi:hypothetical protein
MLVLEVVLSGKGLISGSVFFNVNWSFLYVILRILSLVLTCFARWFCVLHLLELTAFVTDDFFFLYSGVPVC